MKSKIIFLMVIVLISLSISSVCAGDVDNTLIQEKEQITSTNDVIGEYLMDDVVNEGTGSFSELQNLIKNNDVVNLTKNYAAGENEKKVVISGNKTINGNGYTINGNEIIGIFAINEGNVVINNITLKNGKDENGGAITAYANTESLTFNNVIFSDNYADDSGGAVYINAKNQNILTKFINCNFNNNFADNLYGGAIYYNSNQPLFISNSTFKSNKADGDDDGFGGAIYTTTALNVIDSNFIENFGDDKGGAIYNAGNEPFTVTNCLFNKNVADDYHGGAIYSVGDVTIEKSIFTSNTADEYGGAIYGEKSVIVDNSTFKDNYADTRGGAIYTVDLYVNTNQTTRPYNSFFINNKANDDSGVAEVKTAQVKNAVFKGNSAKYNAGGISSTAVTSDMVINVTNCLFESNTGSADGGALHCSYVKAKCYVESSIFNSNSVDGFGGAILIHGDLTIKNCTFNKNYGGSGGGAIYTSNLQVISNQNNTETYTSFFSENTVGGNVIGEKNGGAISAKSANIENAYFYKNRADFHGGAIFTDGDLNVNNCLFESNKATGAYVAACYGGAIRTNKNLKVNNSIFKENSAEDYGGAIYADTASIYSSDFEKNEVTMSTINYVKLGGAIYVANSVNIFDSNFDSNHALVDGGAVYSKHSVSVKNTTFTNNKADGSSRQCYGGAIRSEGDVKVDNSTFEGNHAYDYGGAIFADTITWVNTPSYFIKNYVDDNQGGAIYTNKFTTDVAYGVFIGNQVKANDDGGAIYINKENHITFTHCIFKDNWCGDEGGAIYLDSTSSDLTLKDGNSFINNYAGNQGLDVFNKGTYGTIKNNWWGVASPNFEWGQLIEWKVLPWESNVKHRDSNPLPSPPDGYVPTLNADYLTKVYRNDTQYQVTFYDSEYKPLENASISFDINNVTYYRTTDENGVASLNIRLTPGVYTIKTTNPVTGEIVYKKVKVISNIFRDYDLIKYYKNDTQYTVTILSKDGHAVGAGETVTFNVNGITYTRTTDANGNATLNINLGAGDYTITTEYDGVEDSHKIKVLPVLSAEDLTKKVGTADQFVATLLDGQGKVLAGETVTFNINGVYYQSVTDVEGHAKLNIDLIPGEYIITSSYNGANVANKITITS